MATAACLTLACSDPQQTARTAVSHRGLARRFTSADALLRAVQEANDAYRTLTSTHRVALEIATADGTKERQTCVGVIAVQRPDRFRLTALDGLGVRLFDLLYVRGQVKVMAVGPQLSATSRLPQLLRSIAADVRAIYRLEPRPKVQRRTVEEGVSLRARAPLLELYERSGTTLARQLTVYASSLAVARSEAVDHLGDTRTITYGAYERHGRLLVPRAIVVAKEGTVPYWISIQVARVEIDPRLDDRLFSGK